MNKLKTCSLLLSTIGISVVATLFTTSCNDIIPQAPNDWYKRSKTDNTWVSTFKTWHSDWYIKDDFNPDFDMANPNKYTDNMIKWDIIWNMCWYFDIGVGVRADFHFVSFARIKMNIKFHYTISFNDGSEKKHIMTSTSNDTPTEPKFTQLGKPEPWVAKTDKRYFIQTNYRTIFPSSYTGDYGLSYFLNNLG